MAFHIDTSPIICNNQYKNTGQTCSLQLSEITTDKGGQTMPSASHPQWRPTACLSAKCASTDTGWMYINRIEENL